MDPLEAIAKGVCPKCKGERVTWVPITGISAWCTCCGGTGVYPAPVGSGGDGYYDLTVLASSIKVPLKKRTSRYRKTEDTADQKLAAAKKKLKDTQENPNLNDGDWAAIRTALGKL